MTFAMSRLAMVEICRVFHLSPIPHSEDRIGHGDFQALDAQLSASGLVWIDSCAAHHNVAEFDATYEPFLQALAKNCISFTFCHCIAGPSASNLHSAGNFFLSDAC